MKRLGILMVVALVGAMMAMGPMAMGQNFPIPRPPKTLTQIPARAGWIVEHYWDNADMAALAQEEAQIEETRKASQNDARKEAQEAEGSPSALEQAFVNYLALFPLTESDSLCNSAVTAMMHKADSASASREVFALANKYLFDLDSPMANEEHFLFFLNAARGCRNISAMQRQECAYLESVVASNRVGSEVTDFSFETLDGSLKDFSEIPGQRMLLLYEIGCKDCMAMIQRLKELKGVTIVAVAVNASREAFRNFAPGLPSDWIAGWDSTHSINGGAFAIRKLPDLYLISPSNTVLQKHLKTASY